MVGRLFLFPRVSETASIPRWGFCYKVFGCQDTERSYLYLQIILNFGDVRIRWRDDGSGWKLEWQVRVGYHGLEGDKVMPTAWYARPLLWWILRRRSKPAISQKVIVTP
mgnify:CR=1 FL=1